MSAVRIIIFAKAPQAGRAKTRLIPALGGEGAARLAQRMLQATLATAQAAALGPLQLCLSPPPDDPAWAEFDWPSGVELRDQGEGDLGQRMARAVEEGVQVGLPVLLIGTDCPQLTSELLRQAAEALSRHDSVMFPASDGGYVLLGLRQSHPRVFAEIVWSSASVASSTRERLAELGWSLFEGSVLDDIDCPEDLSKVPAGWLL
jgi:rSAM/selenodomain-associated transferase 1